MGVLVGVVFRIAIVETTRKTISAEEVLPLQAVYRVLGVEVDRYKCARDDFRRHNRQRRIGEIYIRRAWCTEDVVIGTYTNTCAQLEVSNRFFFLPTLFFADENRVRGLQLGPQSRDRNDRHLANLIVLFLVCSAAEPIQRLVGVSGRVGVKSEVVMRYDTQLGGPG